MLQFKELINQLIELAEAAGENLIEFEGREFSALAELEQPLVEASIRLRSGGSDELSLQLLNAAVEFGVRSGLVDDNRAWALAGLGRRMEAMGLWQELVNHPDEGLRAQAQENLRLMTGELSDQLKQLAEAAGENLIEFEGREFSALAELEQPLVEASIRLRSGGSDELSLQLLNAAVEFGVRSGLVDDNRAWALAGLGRRMEAMGLWQELVNHPDEGLRAQAQENLRLMAGELSDQLKQLAEAAGENLIEFEGREFSALAELEQPLVEASIRLRSGGSDELSLQLLDAAVEFGVRSGLVDDNRAWALAGLGRRMEAMGLWQELVNHPDEGLRAQAQENLRLMAGELSDQLKQLAEAAGENLIEFEGREFSALAELEQPLVEASIRLRSGGSDELSLQLLNAAVEFGVRSGLVDDNRAWALAGLGRRMEAMGLWQELVNHPDEGLRAQAQENLRLMTGELSDQLKQLAEAAGENLIEFEGREFSALAELEQPLVEASIRLRSGGSDELSLQLLNAAVEFGVRSGLVDDNRAWALAGLGRRMEAMGLWQELVNHPDEGLRAQAQENLRLMAGELSDQLKQLAEAAGENLIEFEGREFSALAELEQPLVEASIRLRSGGSDELSLQLLDAAVECGGSDELSLQLLDAAVEFGVRSGLVDDNRAWVLVNLGRRMEAMGLWQELVNHPDEGLRAQAQENLRLMAGELSDQLKQLAEAAGENLIEFEGREFSALAELEQPLVEASIRLRSGGSDELSLQLLDAAVEFGVRSGLVDDNRAWALAGLGRRMEAMGLWQELVNHPDEGLRAQAQENLRLMTGELSDQLKQLAEAAGENLIEFAGREFSALAELEQPLVEASIRLRSGGSDELSLQLLDAAVEFGVRSGLVDDNRAWALAGLGRRMEAMGLWQELVNHPDEGLRTQAQENLRLMTGELSDQLKQLAEAAGENLIEFEGREFSALAELEQPLVEASIRLRSQGSNELSLHLLNAAVEYGVRSGLVDDNRAWALLGLGRLPEAVALWREVEALSDNNIFVEMARERLQSYATEVDRILEMNKIQALIDEGQIEQAKTVLLQAMLDDPTWDGYTTMLIQVLKTERGLKVDADLLQRELQEDQLSLEAFDLYLDLVEQRLENVAVKSFS